MKLEKEKTVVFLILRVIISLLFIYAGVEKINDPSTFATAIENYRLFPFPLINLLAVFFPWLEMFAGILLLFNTLPKENLALIFSLTLIFTFAVSIALIRGINIDCGCYGVLGAQKVGIQKIIENTLILIICAVLFFNSGKEEPVQ